MKIRDLIILHIYFLLSCIHAQTPEIDSLKSLLSSSDQKDKLNTYFALGSTYTYINYDSAIKYSNLSIEYIRTHNKELLSRPFIMLGNIYLEKGEYDKSLNYYIEAEKICESSGNKEGLITIMGNIGLVYIEQQLLDKAKIQFNQALESAKENNFNQLIANNLNYLGRVYYLEKDNTSALEKFSESLEIYKKIGAIDNINECLNNIAVIYQESGKYPEALNYFYEYLNQVKKRKEERGLAAAYHNIALVYKDMKNVINTIIYLDSSIVAAKKVHAFQDLAEVYDSYTQLFTEQKNYERAFEYFQLKAIANDSLSKQIRNKQFAEMSTKYQTEKKEAENKILIAKGERQRAITFAVSTGLILASLLAFFIFRSYKEKKKANTLLAQQNNEIRAQKTIIEDQHKDITDSIIYAKRIQDAILPPQQLIDSFFPENFIMYRPKDIVAGDFYWLENKNDHIFIAACDCTGHGVPGAMVSVVCSTALSRSVKEFGLLEPGKILDKTRELVIETFEKSEKGVKDGMDISLLSIHKKSGEIKWAGAFNRLWFSNEQNIEEITADKQPIGQTELPEPFTTHSISIKPGSCIYLFSDGFADQFGGTEGKKLKYRLFKEAIGKNISLSLTDQKLQLQQFFDNWKGIHEQVDDVCVIGLRI